MPTNWTKADYDTNYRFRIEKRMPGGGPPPAENRGAGVVLHYHKFFMAPWLSNRWTKLQTVLGILPGDEVVVFGAGFGWSVDAIIAQTGATVVGIDISQHIADEQANTEDTEVRAAIITGGLDPDIGRGAEVLAFVSDGQPRSNVIVLQNDGSDNTQRQAIRVALGNTNPTVSIADDMIDDDWTDTDIVNLRNAMNGFGGTQRLIFMYSKGGNQSKLSPPRTFQTLLDLLPGSAEVISTDGQTHLLK